MNNRGQRILLWTAPPAVALFALAYLLFPVFSPPLSPTLTPDQVAAFFRSNVTGILGVAILCNLIACSLVPLFAVTAVQISRSATSSPVLTYAYVICVGVGTTAFILADYCWGMAAFRPDRDPQLTSLLNDMAWFFFIAPVGTIMVQNLCFDFSTLGGALQRRDGCAAGPECVLDSLQDGSTRMERWTVIYVAADYVRGLRRGDVLGSPACRETPGR
jgi:hypothetical protein